MQQPIGAHKPKVQDGKNSWERGASNNKARKEYGWTPLFPSWSEGFNNLIGRKHTFNGNDSKIHH